MRPEKWGDSQVGFQGSIASGGRIVLLPGAFWRTCFQNAHFGRISSTLCFTVFRSLGALLHAGAFALPPRAPKSHICPLPHLGLSELIPETNIYACNVFWLELGTSPPLTEVSRENVSQPRAPGPETPKSLKKVSGTVRQVSGESPESVWRVFLECSGTFWRLFGAPGPQRHFRISRPEGPRDLCQRAAKGGTQKGVGHFFLFRSPFGNLFVTFLTFLVTFLPIPFCLPPFAAR